MRRGSPEPQAQARGAPVRQDALVRTSSLPFSAWRVALDLTSGRHGSAKMTRVIARTTRSPRGSKNERAVGTSDTR